MRRERWVFKLAAILLHYPGPGFDTTVAAVEQELAAWSGAARAPATRVLAGAAADLLAFCREARSLAPVEWERRYVETFDFQKERALHLTFHEWDETIERAGALVALKEQVERAGFVCPEDELPDYIPLLLEFLAEKPLEYPDGDLPERLARVLEKIAASLAAADPLYLPVCRAARTALAGLVPKGAAGAGARPNQEAQPEHGVLRWNSSSG